MGDGGVALILDITGIAAKSNLVKASKTEQAAQAEIVASKQRSESQELLSLQLNGPGVYTVPLCLIQRLEEFPRNKVEVSGNQRLVQHRNSILPIISLNDFLKLPHTNTASEDNIHLLVVQKQNRTYGLEVNRILDILTVDAEVEEPVRPQPGYMGNIVAGKDVSTVLDVLTIIDLVTGNDPGNSKGGKIGKTAPKSLHVLLAEDTNFFVKQITKVLTANGIKVTHAPDGEVAFRILEESAPGHFNLIVSDIEMPNLNGFQFAERVRKSPKHSSIPMIAVTTRFRDVDLEQGKKSGFNKYIEKLKADQLMETIYSLMEGA
jgi:two-component system chemotaxis sensor kinase CheA